MNPLDRIINDFADSCHDILRFKLGDTTAADFCDALAEILAYMIKTCKAV
jgi:hypothetical protein